ncbi:MAG: hypothetical protein QOG16_704 [Actinomycetota bacterium]|nr:hypothetical protein [Actinomycetota bacterium]
MATAPNFPFTFALVGAGRVGTAVASLLLSAGNAPQAIASRSQLSAQRASSLLDAPVVDLDDLPDVDVALIGAGDEAIRSIAKQLGSKARVAIHFAGAYGLEPLQPVIESGAWACALHPVQACPDISTAIDRLPGSAWGVTCTWPARQWAHRLIAEQLNGTPIDVGEEARPIWHAAAVSTSNGIAALMAVGERLLASIGLAEPEQILGPLARGTVDNAIAGGGGAATLTGPAIRGDAATVARHLDAIRTSAPELLDAYALAARVILEAGRIDPDTAASIRTLLGDSG